MSSLAIYEHLDDLPQACESLFDAAGKTSFFLTLPWCRNLVRTGLPEAARLRIYVANGENGVKGVLPMMSAAGSRRLEAVSNYYTSLFMPILGETDDAALGSLVEAVSSERWDRIDLHPMDADSPVFEQCAEAFRSCGMIVLPYFCFGNWYLKLDGRSYGEYFETLPSKLKNTLKRKTKQLHAANQARMEIVTEVGEIDAAIAAYEKVYNSSWKVPEPYPEFMPGLIRTCAEQGWLRLGLVFIGAEPVAAQVWIVKDGIAAIYKLAYDERFSKLSAGSILTAGLMRHVIDVDRVNEVDYLTGDDDYKRDWMSHRRERWGLSAYNRRTLRGFCMGTALQMAGFARRFLGDRKRASTDVRLK
ncbi:MAG: GNAT family N-acetyltransferase [Burkholderiales bacterium]|nr:GNAT family N-acetyltransferase [Burkholderiales bacterium]